MAIPTAYLDIADDRRTLEHDVEHTEWVSIFVKHDRQHALDIQPECLKVA